MDRIKYIKDEKSIGKDRLFLLDLPTELVEEILNYLTYDDISHLRMVSRSFNRCCSLLLNRGFIRVEKFHGQCQKKVKAQLPRRESERRNHPLARHSDVLSAIETRLSLLGMTYMKYVDMNLCCFIPGKVIDEIYKVLRVIQNNPNPPRVHELLQELRDISSMAMEYFEEKVAPKLKLKLTSPANFLAAAVGVNMRGHGQMMEFAPIYRSLPPSSASGSNRLTPARPQHDGAEEVTKLCQTVKNLNAMYKKDIGNLKNKMRDGDKQIKELNQTSTEQNARISELDGRVHELNQKLLEYDRQLTPGKVVPALKVAKRVQSKSIQIPVAAELPISRRTRSSAKRIAPDAVAKVSITAKKLKQ